MWKKRKTKHIVFVCWSLPLPLSSFYPPFTVVGGGKWERRWRLRNWLRFVADQRDGHPGTGVYPGLPQPLANVQERATVGDVVHEHARRRTRIVRPGYRPESLLAGRVPHSYFDLPAVQRQRLVSVVHACGKRDFRLHFRGGLPRKGVGVTQQASTGHGHCAKTPQREAWQSQLSAKIVLTTKRFP